MPANEEHVAHPRLFGAPAYARPPLMITPTALPADPDDLPIDAEQTHEERQIAERLLARPYEVAEARSFNVEERTSAPKPEPRLRPELFRLSGLAGKVLRGAS